MAELIIDAEKCIKDGICAASCPIDVIGIDAKTNIPYMYEQRKDTCIDCGHCLSVCSQDALTINGLKPEECSPIQADLVASQPAIEQLLKSRRSIRQFKSKEIPADVITNLIEMVNYAPTGGNRQEISWRIVNDRTKVRDLAGHVVQWMREASAVNKTYANYFSRLIKSWEDGTDDILREAPALLVAVAPAPVSVAMEDGVTAIAQAELAAPSLGLGSCWAGFFHLAAASSTEIKEYLAISENEKCVGAIMLGFPKYKYYRIPKRKQPCMIWV